MQQSDSDASAVLTDKGYDSDAVRRDLRDSGVTSELPTKRNRKVQYSVGQSAYGPMGLCAAVRD
jgi:hypothetical protein